MKLPVLVVTTVGTADDARRLAHTLVERRLAACVQIQAIDSVYRWQGQVQCEPEQRLLCKTTPERAPALMQALREAHPYDLPALHVLATADADAAYAAWVDDSTRDGA